MIIYGPSLIKIPNDRTMGYVTPFRPCTPSNEADIYDHLQQIQEQVPQMQQIQQIPQMQQVPQMQQIQQVPQMQQVQQVPQMQQVQYYGQPGQEVAAQQGGYPAGHSYYTPDGVQAGQVLPVYFVQQPQEVVQEQTAVHTIIPAQQIPSPQIVYIPVPVVPIPQPVEQKPVEFILPQPEMAEPRKELSLETVQVVESSIAATSVAPSEIALSPSPSLAESSKSHSVENNEHTKCLQTEETSKRSKKAEDGAAHDKHSSDDGEYTTYMSTKTQTEFSFKKKKHRQPVQTNTVGTDPNTESSDTDDTLSNSSLNKKYTSRKYRSSQSKNNKSGKEPEKSLAEDKKAKEPQVENTQAVECIENKHTEEPSSSVEPSKEHQEATMVDTAPDLTLEEPSSSVEPSKEHQEAATVDIAPDLTLEEPSSSVEPSKEHQEATMVDTAPDLTLEEPSLSVEPSKEHQEAATVDIAPILTLEEPAVVSLLQEEVSILELPDAEISLSEEQGQDKSISQANAYLSSSESECYQDALDTLETDDRVNEDLLDEEAPQVEQSSAPLETKPLPKNAPVTENPAKSSSKGKAQKKKNSNKKAYLAQQRKTNKKEEEEEQTQLSMQKEEAYDTPQNLESFVALQKDLESLFSAEATENTLSKLAKEANQILTSLETERSRADTEKKKAIRSFIKTLAIPSSAAKSRNGKKSKSGTSSKPALPLDITEHVSRREKALYGATTPGEYKKVLDNSQWEQYKEHVGSYMKQIFTTEKLRLDKSSNANNEKVRSVLNDLCGSGNTKNFLERVQAQLGQLENALFSLELCRQFADDHGSSSTGSDRYSVRILTGNRETTLQSKSVEKILLPENSSKISFGKGTALSICAKYLPVQKLRLINTDTACPYVKNLIKELPMLKVLEVVYIDAPGTANANGAESAYRKVDLEDVLALRNTQLKGVILKNMKVVRETSMQSANPKPAQNSAQSGLLEFLQLIQVEAPACTFACKSLHMVTTLAVSKPVIVAKAPMGVSQELCFKNYSSLVTLVIEGDSSVEKITLGDRYTQPKGLKYVYVRNMKGLKTLHICTKSNELSIANFEQCPLLKSIDGMEKRTWKSLEFFNIAGSTSLLKDPLWSTSLVQSKSDAMNLKGLKLVLDHSNSKDETSSYSVLVCLNAIAAVVKNVMESTADKQFLSSWKTLISSEISSLATSNMSSTALINYLDFLVLSQIEQ
ncbi:hypothetical protein NECID01_0084 [Nematocida sp. AWRm77]|nr:hypothetical protein NECID01_0084 [Nematocida sp. AWRm77]